MREGDRAVHLHAIALAGSPHGAGEIAQAVGGKQRGLLKRRDKKRAAQMRLVVFDAMELGARSFFGSASNACASASGMPTNCVSTLARSRAKRGMRSAYNSFVPRRAQGFRGTAT